MKKSIFASASVFVFTFVFSLFQIGFVHAETHITADADFYNGASWTKDRSPYILDDSVFIPSFQNLYIGPGVIIVASSTADNPIGITDFGNIDIEGTAKEPVVIDGLDDMDFGRSIISISYANIHLVNGISMLGSTSTISSSTIEGSPTGISVRQSLLTINDSSITGNNYGIYSYYYNPSPVLSFLGRFFGYLLGRPAQADIADDPKQNHIYISNSDIVNNHTYGIFNATTNVVHAENNWWGSVNGPADASSGLVSTVPWLVNDPFATSSTSSCCSNVLFLPGIEASRLYLDERAISEGHFATTTTKLWEPIRNDNVRSLFLNNSGQSINSSIYTKDIIDSAFGLGVYKNFIAMMNDVVASSTINAWEPFPYDWRFDVDTIAKSPKLMNDFQALASSSKTGKVTIVAHSDGGLVAKNFASILTDKGKAGLIDKVIMVAVPEFGTPEAVAGLLHGDDQEILGGVILNADVARELGENSPGAYGLLPSKSYFNNTFSTLPANLLEPIISFASSTLAGFDFSKYGQTISTYDSLHSFLAGLLDHRSQPDSSNVNIPDDLHVPMINATQAIHEHLDDFSFSSSTPVISIIGWGNDTTKSIHYYEETSCNVPGGVGDMFISLAACTTSLEHTDMTTHFGDGTVVAASAQGLGGSNSKDYYFDLRSENRGALIPDDHATILNTSPVDSLIRNQIVATDNAQATPVAVGLPLYISEHAPTLADLHDDDLVVTVHSPVQLDVYDSHGGHVGPIPNSYPDSDLEHYETTIPGSSYRPNSVSTSVTVPYGIDYKVILKGTGDGSFSIDTQRDLNDTMTPLADFEDMPVTPLLKAELVLATTTYVSATSTSGKSLTVATTSSLLLMDFDGDGTIDATSTSNNIYDPTLYLRGMRHMILSYHLDPAREKSMCEKIDKIIAYIQSKKTIKIDEKSSQALRIMVKGFDDNHWVFKGSAQDKRDQLTTMYQSILDTADI